MAWTYLSELRAREVYLISQLPQIDIHTSGPLANVPESCGKRRIRALDMSFELFVKSSAAFPKFRVQAKNERPNDLT
jgi:hypothetical protein